MSDNVQDGFGPVLQRIQSELAAIRSKQEDHDRRFDQVDRRFDRLDAQINEVDRDVSHALGIATRSLTRAATANATSDAVEKSIAGLTARIEALESR